MRTYTILFLFCLINHWAVAQSDIKAQDNSRSVLILNSYTENILWSSRVVAYLDSLLSDKYPDIQIYTGNLNCNEICTKSSLQLSLRAALWQIAELKGEIFDATNLSLAAMFPRKITPDVIIFLGDEVEAIYKSVHLVMGKWKFIPTVSCAVLNEQLNQIWLPENKPDFHLMEPNRDFGAVTHVKDALKLRKIYLDYMGQEAVPQDCVWIDGKWMYQTKVPNTKVYTPVLVRENLELMKRLMPKAQEIVWIDDNYLKADYALFKLQECIGEIFPQAKFTAITHNKLNTDSIYNVMMEPVENRFFITYSWNLDGEYSIRPKKVIDSLLNYELNSPILTLTERNLKGNNYWLGGVHIQPEEYADKTFRAIKQILNGICIDSIPLQSASNFEVHLNMTTLKRFGLDKRINELEGKVILRNIPPTFYEQYEGQILGSLIGLVLLIALLIYLVRKRHFTKMMKIESENYQRLYDKLQTIYQSSSLNFALYEGNGQLLFRIINGQKCTLAPKENELFTENLFSNPHLSKELKKQIKARQSVNCELEISLKSRKKQFFQLVVKCLEANVYGQACYVVIATDLTSVVQERQAKREMESMFNYISESAQMGVAIYNLLDGEGLATPRWYENLNEKPQKGILPLYINTSPEDRELLVAYQNKMKQEYVEQPFARDIQVTDKEKKLHWIREYIFIKYFAPHKNEVLVVELNMNRDAQKQKEAELADLKERAEISNLETQHFLTNISHEIRTPLNAIVGFASLLGSCEDPTEMGDVTSIITQNNQLLVALIDNILHLSKIDSGTLSFQYIPIQLFSLFQSWEIYANASLHGKPISLFWELPVEIGSICTDEMQLNTVMKNLISNAIKFTESGNITIGYQRRENEHYFFVKDTGSGIPYEEQERIFKRFEKLNPFTQGTGLGLALCQSIVIHLGGKIGVESELGKGSLFWVILPD